MYSSVMFANSMKHIDRSVIIPMQCTTWNTAYLPVRGIHNRSTTVQVLIDSPEKFKLVSYMVAVILTDHKNVFGGICAQGLVLSDCAVQNFTNTFKGLSDPYWPPHMMAEYRQRYSQLLDQHNLRLETNNENEQQHNQAYFVVRETRPFPVGYAEPHFLNVGSLDLQQAANQIVLKTFNTIPNSLRYPQNPFIRPDQLLQKVAEGEFTMDTKNMYNKKGLKKDIQRLIDHNIFSAAELGIKG